VSLDPRGVWPIPTAQRTTGFKVTLYSRHQLQKFERALGWRKLSDLNALTGKRNPQLVPRDHPSEDKDAGMATGERIEGLEGVASLMDALMRAGGDEVDYESLLAVSQSMQLSM